MNKAIATYVKPLSTKTKVGDHRGCPNGNLSSLDLQLVLGYQRIKSIGFSCSCSCCTVFAFSTIVQFEGHILVHYL